MDFRKNVQSVENNFNRSLKLATIRKDYISEVSA